MTTTWRKERLKAQRETGRERGRVADLTPSLTLDNTHATGRRDNSEKDRPTCLSAINHKRASGFSRASASVSVHLCMHAGSGERVNQPSRPNWCLLMLSCGGGLKHKAPGAHSVHLGL